MGVGTLMSLEEYLCTSYSPDREYIDGAVVERHVGEIPHGIVQSNVVYALRRLYPGFRVWPEVRLRTLAGRCRIPDVLVVSDRPRTAVLETPPSIIVEILSPSDEMSNVIEKLEEYRSIGVRNIWVLDPRRRKGYTFDVRGLEELQGSELIADELGIRLGLDDVFQDL
jgi:Uma2 family endonuclease